MNVGERVKNISCSKLGLTLKQVSMLSGILISTLIRIENNKQEVTVLDG